MADGMNEGVEFFANLDISFGDIAEQVVGDLGDFKDAIEIPEIDFDEFRDELGEIFGDIAEFGKDIGEKIIENVGDLIENAGEWLS